MKFAAILAGLSAAAIASTATAQVTLQPTPSIEVEAEAGATVQSGTFVMMADGTREGPFDIITDADGTSRIAGTDVIVSADTDNSIMHTVTLADGTRAGDIETLVRDVDGELESIILLVRGGVNDPVVPVEIDLTGAQFIDGEIVLAFDETQFMEMVAAANAEM